jgi:transcriptional regulator with XRE-family HTH domain
MNKPDWTPELGLLLESLRIQAGMDLATMARRNMLSTLQVKQLEKGGNSGFYNDAIKFSTGQKLLKFFGHELKLETETLVYETGAALLAPDHAPALAIEPVSLPLPEVAVKPSEVAIESIKPMPIELIEPSDEQPEAATSNAKPYWLGLAFIVIAMLVFGFFQTYGPANPSLNTAPSVESELKPPESEKMSSQQVDAASAPSTSTQAAPEKSSMSAATATEKIETPQLLNTSCQWTDQVTELQASAPRKRGEYVHVVALENATVCIKDGDQRVASLSLAAGQARSIYGPPPFRVYSPNLSLVKLYFQGEYIKLPSEDIRQIKLSPSALQ